jgi:hypothetical protein
MPQMTQIAQIEKRSRGRPKAGLSTERRGLKNESCCLSLVGLILSGLAVRSAALRAARERCSSVSWPASLIEFNLRNLRNLRMNPRDRRGTTQLLTGIKRRI